jgi:hypothetical protein
VGKRRKDDQPAGHGDTEHRPQDLHDLLSTTLYYLCHRRQHQHMIIRRRKASTDDQPHYSIVDEMKANHVLRSRLDPGDSPCASDRVKVILC